MLTFYVPLHFHCILQKMYCREKSFTGTHRNRLHDLLGSFCLISVIRCLIFYVNSHFYTANIFVYKTFNMAVPGPPFLQTCDFTVLFQLNVPTMEVLLFCKRSIPKHRNSSSVTVLNSDFPFVGSDHTLAIAFDSELFYCTYVGIFIFSINLHVSVLHLHFCWYPHSHHSVALDKSLNLSSFCKMRIMVCWE